MPFNGIEELLRQKLLGEIGGGELSLPEARPLSQILAEEEAPSPMDVPVEDLPGKRIVGSPTTIEANVEEPPHLTPSMPEPMEEPQFDPIPNLRGSEPEIKKADPYELPDLELDKLISGADDKDDKSSLWTAISRAWANAGEGMTGVTSDKGLWDSLQAQAKRRGVRARAKVGEESAQLALRQKKSEEDANDPGTAAARELIKKAGYGDVITDQMNARQLKGVFGKYYDKIQDLAIRKYLGDSVIKANKDKTLDAQAFQDYRDKTKEDSELKMQGIKDKAALERAKILAGQRGTPGTRAVDNAFGKDYAEYSLGGGSANAQRNLDSIDYVIDKLGKTDNASGPLVGLIPKEARDIITPEGAALQDEVARVIAAQMRQTLGAQFTEKENREFIAREFNPRQEEPELIRRLTNVKKQLESAAKAKEEAARYFQKNGTMAGYNGKTSFSFSDFGEGASPASSIKKRNINEMTEEEMDAEIQRIEQRKNRP